MSLTPYLLKIIIDTVVKYQNSATQAPMINAILWPSISFSNSKNLFIEKIINLILSKIYYTRKLINFFENIIIYN